MTFYSICCIINKICFGDVEMKKGLSIPKAAIILAAVLVVSIIIGCFTVKNNKKSADNGESTYEKPSVSSKENTAVESTTEPTSVTRSYASYISEGRTYINDILVVNKTYSIPEDYAPGIDPKAQAAFDEMESAAADDGISLWIRSGYRSYSYQKQLYENYAAKDGYAEADTYSARPGHSEHQTGLAFDLNSLSTSFGETAEGKWLAENCWKYGFIIRYPQGKEDITGYQYEPWHVRYLGKDAAKDVYDSGLTLEEYLGIKSEYKN